MVLYPFEGKESAVEYGALSIKRRKFYERKKTVPALACDFEREVFLLYAKIVSRDRLL